MNPAAYKPPLRVFLPRALRVYSDPLATFLSWRRTFGETYIVPLTSPPIHHLHNPADIRQVLVTHQERYRKAGGLVIGRLLLGNGLLSSEDPIHARQRRIIQPWVHRSRVATLPGTIAGTVDRYLRHWDGRREVDIAREMAALSLAVVGQAMFSNAFHDVAGRLIPAFVECQRFIQPKSFIVLPRRWRTPGRRRYEAAIRIIDDIIGDMIRARRAHPESADDMLTALITARQDSGEPMDDRQIRDELVTIILAGHETTANALAWAWYLLLMNPDVAAKLRDQVDTACVPGTPDPPELTAIGYAEQVFLESMRLYPPAWILARRVMEKDSLESGTVLLPGHHVVMMPYVVHRDERWFPDPDKFDPDRFSPEQRQTRPPFSYFPFGGGARGCIGEAFATTEAVIILSMITRRYTMTLVPGQTIETETLLTLRPKRGIRVQLTRR